MANNGFVPDKLWNPWSGKRIAPAWEAACYLLKKNRGTKTLWTEVVDAMTEAGDDPIVEKTAWNILFRAMRVGAIERTVINIRGEKSYYLELSKEACDFLDDYAEWVIAGPKEPFEQNGETFVYLDDRPDRVIYKSTSSDKMISDTGPKSSVKTWILKPKTRPDQPKGKKK